MCHPPNVADDTDDDPEFERDDSAPMSEIVHETTGVIRKRIRDADSLIGLRGALETYSKITNLRLAQGAKEFAGIKGKLEKLTAPAPKWQVIAVMTTIVMIVAGLIWNASRMPERSEFEGLRRMAEQRTGDLTLTQTLMGRDVAELREALKRIEASSAATASKVDQLLITKAHP